jgi:cytidine deaminase
VRSRSGRVYTGICLDLACGIGFCAEHAAIAAMLEHRESAIEAVVAVGTGVILAPCGRCRELMVQINPGNLDCQVVLGEDRMVALRSLLPEHWLDTVTGEPAAAPDRGGTPIDPGHRRGGLERGRLPRPDCESFGK